jgi:hypothetical protein
MADFDVEAHLLTEFTDLGDRVKRNLWRPEDQKSLTQIARSITGLTAKMLAATDPAKRARYEEDIRLLGNHVVVLAFSRANIVEKEVGETILRVLEKVVNVIIDFVLARVGLK